MPRIVRLGAAALFLTIGLVGSAHAQNLQPQLNRLFALCGQGYKPACIRFGLILGEQRGRAREWRRLHPEWCWWERW